MPSASGFCVTQGRFLATCRINSLDRCCELSLSQVSHGTLDSPSPFLLLWVQTFKKLCMYMYGFVCINGYVCIYELVYEYVCMHAYMHEYGFVCGVYMYVDLYVFVILSMGMYVCMYSVCLNACMCVCCYYKA